MKERIAALLHQLRKQSLKLELLESDLTKIKKEIEPLFQSPIIK